METIIKSKYLNMDLNFELTTMQRFDGPVNIIPHDTLFNIINNQLADKEIKYDYIYVTTSKSHCFVQCVIWDKHGRRVMEHGESTYESLTTKIAKTIPGTIAAIRAFDRAAIKFLDLDCTGKVYSDKEIPAEEANTYQIPNTEKDEEKQTPVMSEAPRTEYNKSVSEGDASPSVINKTTEEQETPESSAQPKQQMDVGSGTIVSGKLKDSVLNTLSEHTEVIVYDTETTGLKAADDQIVEIAAQKFSIAPNLSLTLMDELHQYIKPSIPMSPSATAINAITDELLEDKPNEGAAFLDIYDFFGENPQILSGHGVGFDIRFLKEMYKRQGKELKPQAELDTCKIAKDIVKVENYKLETLAKFYKMEEVDFHSASTDTDCTAKLLKIFIQAYCSESSAGPMPSDGNVEKLQPTILSMELYSPSSAVCRIYVNTTAKTVFYDIINKCWQAKNADMSKLDIDYIEKEAWKIAGANNLQEFEKFQGKWSDSKAQAA